MLPMPIKIVLPDGFVKLVLTPTITLNYVLYVPEFKHNLLSVGKLLDQNHFVAKFEHNLCVSRDLTTSKVLAVGQRHQGLYKFKGHVSNGFNQFPSSSVNATSVCFAILHMDL